MIVRDRTFWNNWTLWCVALRKTSADFFGSNVIKLKLCVIQSIGQFFPIWTTFQVSLTIILIFWIYFPPLHLCNYIETKMKSTGRPKISHQNQTFAFTFSHKQINKQTNWYAVCIQLHRVLNFLGDLEKIMKRTITTQKNFPATNHASALFPPFFEFLLLTIEMMLFLKWFPWICMD